MVSLAGISKAIQITLAGAALIAALAGAFVTGKALVALPSQMSQHDSTTRELVDVGKKELCITIADHRKMDYNLCFSHPSEVMDP